MIQFNGYDSIIRSVYDSGQEHVFAYWNDLSDAERKTLLEDIAPIDFGTLGELFSLTGHDTVVPAEFGPSPYITLPRTEEEKRVWTDAKSRGIEIIRQGRVAAFIVAGGQGSRLGFDGPKGAFRMSPVKNKSLFQIHTEKVKKYGEKYGITVPLFIMTSDVNHAATVAHFTEHDFFGLRRSDVFFFPQNMIPSLDTHGKLILAKKHRIFKNPDGHGGSLVALRTSGSLDEMKRRGIDIVSYIQVDNPLVSIVDPVFVGFHDLHRSEVSSKALTKAYPDEKIGSFVRFSDGHDGIVEYSDLPKEKMFATNADRSLTYAAGSIAIHLFRREFIERITDKESPTLPFHVARKKISAIVSGSIAEIDGFKFEKFAFDAIPLAEKTIIIETIRTHEFAPVKNATGVDSVETSRSLMNGLFRSWLAEKGIAVPAGTETIEISPNVAVEADDLPAGLSIPDQKKVYIG